MANSNTSRVDTQTSLWFNQLRMLCFPSKKDNGNQPIRPRNINFLHLFLAPMCAPCRNGFGSDNGKSGRAKTGHNPANVIAENQLILVNNYLNHLENIAFPQVTDSSDPATVAQALAEDLVSQSFLKNKDVIYSGKADRCTSERFLSFFSGAKYLAGTNVSGMMVKAVELYTQIARLIYRDTPEITRSWIRDKLTSAIQDQCPQLSLPEFSDAMEELGWKICVRLLLSAWKDKPTADATALVNVLLGTKMPEVAFSDAPVAPTGTVTLDMGPFRTVLAAALRSELDLREIRACFTILTALHQSSPSFPPPALVQGFLERISSLFAQKKEALDDDDRYEELQAEMAELRSIRKECEKFLPAEP